MTTEVTKPQPSSLYGLDDHIAGLVRRMRFMIKGAQDAPDAIVWRAAQIANLHKLDPFTGDIHIYTPYKSGLDDPERWIIDVGIAAWRRAAQRQAKYIVKQRELSAAEIVAIIGEERYTENDVGIEASLYRLDVMRECQAFDLEYEPNIARGFYLHKARWDKYDKVWIPDTLANTETPIDKAKRRAEKKAIKIAFSLDYPDEMPTQWQITQDIEGQIVSEERARLPVHRPELRREEDGDLLWM